MLGKTLAWQFLAFRLRVYNLQKIIAVQSRGALGHRFRDHLDDQSDIVGKNSSPLPSGQPKLLGVLSVQTKDWVQLYSSLALPAFLSPD